MLSRWQWLVLQFTRTLWVRATLYAALAVASALLAMVLNPFIPGDLAGKIGADAVDRLLDILASSMLAVTTFSLTVMVSAYSAATSNVTPRATRLLMQDTTTQNVLSTFLGSFLFSLVGIIGLSAGAYGESGRVVLYAVSLGVIVVVVLTMLRWIQHLSTFGRMGDTISRVERAASQALKSRLENPYLGGHALLSCEQIPLGAQAVHATSVGYVQHLDIACLNECAEHHGGQVFVIAPPGRFISPASVLAYVVGIPVEQASHAVINAFTIGSERSFDQDPRFGLCVLAEIASRALSPAVNDPGTALDVLGRAVRVLSLCAGSVSRSHHEPVYPAVWVGPLDLTDLFDDLFAPVARDGAGLVEVQIRLQRALHELVRMDPTGFGLAAARASQNARIRAEHGLLLVDEKHRVACLSEQVVAHANVSKVA